MDTKNYTEKALATGKKLFSKSHLKKAAAVVAVCAIIGGGTGWYMHQQKQERHTQALAAQTTMIEAQAKEKGINLIAEDQVAAITASAIGVDGSNIQYKHMNLALAQKDKHDAYGDDDKNEKEHGKKHDKDKNEREDKERSVGTPAQAVEAATGATQQKTETAQNTEAAFSPIYNVACQANNVKYQLKIDALTGAVLSSKVKNA